MRAGANILLPINVSSKYPPGTVVDYAYNVFNQVGGPPTLPSTPHHYQSHQHQYIINLYIIIIIVL